MSAKTVFISYSHDSSEHAARVRALGASLSRDGCECRIDAFKDTGEDWPAWMTRQLTEADFVLCVVTETYARRFVGNELPDVGLGVGWEAGLIRRLLYAKKLLNERIFPVVFSSADQQHIPLELQGYDYFLLEGQADYETLLRKLLNRPLHIRPEIGTPPALHTQTTAPLFARPDGELTPKHGVSADISRIVKYAPAELIGREEETKLLNDAWDQAVRGEKKRPHIMTFVALGGEGKTSLVAKWAASLAADDWPGCDAVFAWSFYSQGTREQLAASSDLFLKEALIFFGDDADKEFAGSAAGAFEKGQRLARIVGQRRSLLILDGLEPLQYAPTSPTPGELKDQGIAALLKGLATNSQGLCVVTTRYSLPDLRAFRQTTAPEVKLLRLSRDAGVHLLKSFNVRGSDRKNIPFDNNKEMLSEFERLVEDVKGHALTLNLLGSYLRNAHGGDIRKRDLINFADADAANEHKHHVVHVMDAYVRWLSPTGFRAWIRRLFSRQERETQVEGKRALAVLRLVGLFDRPVTDDCLGTLLKAPAISGLTKPLVKLNDAQLNTVLKRLENAKLLTVNRDASGALVSLDAHPHLREYFARQLRTQQPGAWRAAHRRLYEHLCATTPDKPQPTLEDLQPLYQAVAHGCQAGLQRDALRRAFLGRIERDDVRYAMKNLGAVGSNLGALASFFDSPWGSVSSSLTKEERGFLFGAVAYHLHALGRLTEALEPMRAGLKSRVEEEEYWAGAAIETNNLSELELTLGEVAGAVADAEHSVTYADRSGDVGMRILMRTTHADALHHAGRRAEAEKRFRESEQMQTKDQPAYPVLYSLQGFQYCDLLLHRPERAAWEAVLGYGGNSDLSEDATLISAVDEAISSKAPSPLRSVGAHQSCRAVSERAKQTLDWSVELFNFGLLSDALDHLTLGRGALYETIVENSDFRLPTSDLSHIDAAVIGLRRAGSQGHIPRGLLTRAWLRFLTGEITGAESAQEDLDEAWDIAERGPMRLFMADIHLYRARLFYAVQPYPWATDADGKPRGPKDDLAAARKLIEQCGYWRRKEELEDAEEAAKNWSSDATGLSSDAKSL